MQKESTNITIFTDMSYYNGIMGFAYYIRSDHKQILQAGGFQDASPSSYKNEMLAIGKALQHAKEAHIGKNINRVYIYCDNQSCVDSLAQYSSKQEIKQKDIEFKDRLVRFLDALGWTIEARKVKAHTRGNTRQRSINNWMDTEARRARKNIENKLGGYQK